ncbi:hypothetical protein, partial [Thiolapillus sp.]
TSGTSRPFRRLRIGTKNNRNYSKRKSMIYRDLTGRHTLEIGRQWQRQSGRSALTKNTVSQNLPDHIQVEMAPYFRLGLNQDF